MSNLNSDHLEGIQAKFSSAGIAQRRLRRDLLATSWRLSLLAVAVLRRLMDVSVSLFALVLTFPLCLAVGVFLAFRGKTIFRSEVRIGRWCVPFTVAEFNVGGNLSALLRKLRIHRLPVFLNVLRGDMSLIGPRAVRPEEFDLRSRAVRKRASVRPGMLTLWWLRKRANIHFSSELDVDLEYVDRQTPSGDLGIALRAIPSVLYGGPAKKTSPTVDVLGIPVDNLTMDEALQYILRAGCGEEPRQICFVNTDCINKSLKDSGYKQLLCDCALILADGIGIRLAGKITGNEIRQNVNGTDLFPMLCQKLQNSHLGLFFLGARPEVVEAFAGWVTKNYPGVRVRGYQDGYFDATQEAAVCEQIRSSGAEILLVALGAPRQDVWIRNNLPSLGSVRVAMGVGGLFDFYSGRIPRAPQWLRELSLEWVYRLYQEPKRMWRRYLMGNLVFLTRIVASTLVCRFRNRPLKA